MDQEVRISGNNFWRIRDKLGRHIKMCLLDKEADREVALWDIEIDEMDESTDAVGLLRAKARGLGSNGDVAVRYVGYFCASKLDDDAMTDLVRSRRKAARDLSLLEIGPPAPGR